MVNRAIFVDRDGTINEDIGYVSRPEELKLYPFAAEAIRLANAAGFKLIIVTNQAGIARGLYSEEDLSAIHALMTEEFLRQGARVDAIYYCPHHPEIGDGKYRLACECRKPRPGLLKTAALDYGIDLSRSYVIGDKASDIELAANTGSKGVLVLTGYGRQTIDNPTLWPCEPALVARDLLDGVRRILDTQKPGS
jgi:D-glycero-D-manno-heptose 1,7-bisphosphate phosphatase